MQMIINERWPRSISVWSLRVIAVGLVLLPITMLYWGASTCKAFGLEQIMDIGDDYEGYKEIAIIDDKNRLRIATLIEELLKAKKIPAVIEGSVTYSLLVPSHYSDAAIRILKSSGMLEHKGINLVRRMNRK